MSEPTVTLAPAAAVLHRDADVVAVSKPAGVAVIPARGEPEAACLQRRLEAELGERLFVVHRLDRDTSGVVVFARHADAHRTLCMAFERRQVAKTYLAFVAGTLAPLAGRIDVPLHEARRGKTRPARPGEPGAITAATSYQARRCWRGDVPVTLLEARPLTGRHHQIRVHLRAVGAPILFDPLYGGGAAVPGARPEGPFADSPCRRLALHALRLAVPSPRDPTGTPIVIEAPLADDLVALRTWLDTQWAGVAVSTGDGGQEAGGE